MKFIFEQIRTGGDRNFAYLIGDREAKVAAVVDPSYDPEAVIGRAKAQGLDVKYIGMLELGHSVQARSGFVRVAMRELQQRWGKHGRKYVERAIKRANVKARMTAKEASIAKLFASDLPSGPTGFGFTGGAATPKIHAGRRLRF